MYIYMNIYYFKSFPCVRDARITLTEKIANGQTNEWEAIFH